MHETKMRLAVKVTQQTLKKRVQHEQKSKQLKKNINSVRKKSDESI